MAWSVAALLCACGSGRSQEGANGGGAAGNAGGEIQAGGFQQTAGTSGSPNAGAGGNHNAGSSGTATTGGGASSQGCHSVSECPTGAFGIAMCLVPGQAPPAASCGAPQWCGQCSCPPQPAMPAGTGMACETNQDCPLPTANTVSASICSNGTCSACAQDSDCSSSLPACGSVQPRFAPSFRLCSACVVDSDCPSERPHCQGSYGVSACVACLTTADCSTGVCNLGSCIPQCSPTQACGEAMECSTEQRCQALSCQSDVDCPVNYACTNGHCGRRACTADAACVGNCVNGACYQALGTCYLFMQAA